MKLRPAHDGDVSAIQGLYDEFYPAPAPRAHNVIATQTVQVAESPDGTTIGFRAISPSHFVWIGVTADHRQRGIGRLLMNDALEHAAESGAKELTSRVYEANMAGLAFCERFEFKPYLHMVNLELDLMSWGDSHLVPPLNSPTAQGITFKTYADYGDSDSSRQRLYALNKALSATIPRAEPQPFIDFDTYVQRRISPESYPPTGIFLAVDGDQWIGMSQISLHEGHAFQEMTGVLPDYRGQSLAQSLKLLAIQFARENNRKVIKTFNDVSNAPMIAVNEKLGYQRGEAFYFMRRRLTE